MPIRSSLKSLFTALLALLAVGCADVPVDDHQETVIDEKNNCTHPGTAEQMFGVNLDRLPHDFGSEGQWSFDDYANKLINLEARWVRVLYWNQNGEMDGNLAGGKARIQAFKEKLEWLRRNGMRVMLVVDHNAVRQALPSYGADDATWDRYTTAYVAELNDAITTLGPVVDAWQLLNEPNQNADGASPPGKMTAARFGKMFKAGSDMLRARLPQTTIVLAGLVNWTSREDHDANGPKYLRTAIETVGRMSYDVVAIHTYGAINSHLAVPNPANWHNSPLHQEFRRQPVAFAEFLDDSMRRNVKMWVTEFGGPLREDSRADDADVSTYRNAAMNIGFKTWQATAVERAFYFTMTDHGGSQGDAQGNNDENLGLLRENLSPRPAYTLFDNLTWSDRKGCALDNLPAAGPIPMGNGNTGNTGDAARTVKMRLKTKGTVQVRVLVNDQVKASRRLEAWDWREESFDVGQAVRLNQIKVQLMEDFGSQQDLWVDWVEVNGQRRKTNAEDVLAKGVWRNNRCSDVGRSWGSLLNCNEGYFDFKNVPAPGNGGSAANPNVVKMWLKTKGTVKLRLWVNGQVKADRRLEAWNWRAESFDVGQAVQINQIKVQLLDDFGTSEDLWVDWVEVGGQRTKTNHPQVLSKGVWGANGCSEEGRSWSNLLNCNEGYFDFRNVGGSTGGNHGGGNNGGGNTGGNSGNETHLIKLRVRTVDTVKINLIVWGTLRETRTLNSPEWQTLTFDTGRWAQANSVKVKLTGDRGEGTDLMVQWVEANGDRITIWDAGVRAQGFWDGNQCTPLGPVRSDTLHCNDGLFDFTGAR